MLTDAEQLGTPSDLRCDATTGFADIQAAIATLLDERHYIGGVLHASLPYQPWWAPRIEGSRDRYCACDRRSLFLYLLSPSAEFTYDAVRAFEQRFASEAGQSLENRPAGPAGRHPVVAYFPLVPPPAARYELLTRLASEEAVFAADQEPLNDPGEAQLPAMIVDLNRATKARLALHLDRLELLAPVEVPHDTEWHWTVAPLHEGSSQNQETPSLTFATEGERRAIEFEPSGESDGVQYESELTLKFHSTSEAHTPAVEASKQTAYFSIRNRGSGRGQEDFLFELAADWTGSRNGVLEAAAARTTDEGCSSHNAVANHLRLARSKATVARFLVRVTWDQ